MDGVDFVDFWGVPRFPQCMVYLLVDGFNPFEKYQSNWESFPQIGMNMKKYLSCHHLVYLPIRYTF